MTSFLRSRAVFIVSLFVFALLMIAVGEQGARGDTGPIPENARAKGYGTGWECNRGYSLVKGACTAVTIPANAYPAGTSFGQGWQCNHGFKAAGEACVAIKILANAYLQPSGDSWHCERTYRKVDDTCMAVAVPLNGYLADSAYGLGWKCERGFQAVDEACVALKMPEHTHLDYSGNNWNCNKPYRKKHDKCTLF
jgi:hypothetical protein